MLRKISSAVSSFTGSPGPLPASHSAPARAKAYTEIAQSLLSAGVPVSISDCASCDSSACENEENNGRNVVDGSDKPWDGKTYDEYVMEKYGELEGLPDGFDTDWESDLIGSGSALRGRIVVISTGKSDWEREHTDEVKSLSHKLSKHILSLNLPESKGTKGASSAAACVVPSAFPSPSQLLESPVSIPPSLYSSSLISQSDDPEDQSAIVFPDWKVCLEVENSDAGAKGLWEGALDGKLGRAGKALVDGGEDVERRRSWVLPYRAIVLLCSHKRRDKRCHIAAPLLRAALHTCLAKHGIEVDETGASLANLDGPPLEEIEGNESEREVEVGKRIEEIEGVNGGEGGQVGIFNINHLGGHRYAGVMLILFPSGAYLSYGRVTPQEIPRVVEETILQGKVVPGLLRNGTGLARPHGSSCGFLGW